jgi:hypothetical protein
MPGISATSAPTTPTRRRPPVPEVLPLELMETKAFGSVVYERYVR